MAKTIKPLVLDLSEVGAGDVQLVGGKCASLGELFRALVPRGVYRFSSFEEADAWMTRMMARTHVSRSSTTSSASPAR